MYDAYLEQHISLHLKNQDDEYYKFGYRSFGPYLFGMSTWLHQEVRKNDLKRILFLARDGYMVKRAFDLLFSGEEDQDEKVESSYIYASRRSFAVPTLKDSRNLEELFIKYPYLKTHFGKALMKLGVPKKEVEALPQSLLNAVFNDAKELLSHQEACKVLSRFFPQIIQNSQQEAELLQAYFKQEDIQGDIGIFDIGWHGTLEAALYSLKDQLNIASIRGYYAGILPRKSTAVLEHSKGYLFDRQHDTGYYKFMGLNFPIFERLFQPQEGSCIGFEKEENRIVPKLEEFLHEEGSQDQTNLLTIQAGALAFVENFAKELPANSPYWHKEDAKFWFSGFQQVIKFPCASEVKALGQLTLENEGEIYSLAAPKGLFTYIFKPREFFKDFQKSWKGAFLQRLLKLPLPYYQLLKWYYKLEI